MVTGKPGCGKTILANQLCYGHVKNGGRALYLTLLTETHGRMMAALKSMAFFDASLVGKRLHYVGVLKILEENGFDDLLNVMRQEIQKHNASVLVLDGLIIAKAFAASELLLKQFIYEMQIGLEMFDCTAILITGKTKEPSYDTHETMVDGLIDLSMKTSNGQVIRELKIKKHRGSAHILDPNRLYISSEGLFVQPRFESLYDNGVFRGFSTRGHTVCTGTDGLDAALGGGLLEGSTTTMIGPMEPQKLMIGIQFLLYGGAVDEPSLYLTSSTAPRKRVEYSDSIAKKLEDALSSRQIHVMLMKPEENSVDMFVCQLMQRIFEHKIKRLFIDNLDNICLMLQPNCHIYELLSCLTRILSERNVTTVISHGGCLNIHDSTIRRADEYSAFNSANCILHFSSADAMSEKNTMTIVSSSKLDLQRKTFELMTTADAVVVQMPAEVGSRDKGMYGGRVIDALV
jgi:circadian clock protein KaiC